MHFAAILIWDLLLDEYLTSNTRRLTICQMEFIIFLDQPYQLLVLCNRTKYLTKWFNIILDINVLILNHYLTVLDDIGFIDLDFQMQLQLFLRLYS